jgi:hypothetical protein
MTENDPILVSVRLKSIILFFEGNVRRRIGEPTMLNVVPESEARPKKMIKEKRRNDTISQKNELSH